MKLFYDACHSAIVHAREGNHFGTLLWLETAQRHQARLARQARARVETSVLLHLSDYFARTVEASQALWAGREDLAAVTFITEDAMLRKAVEHLGDISPRWDKRVEGGSLPERWADTMS